MKTLFIVEIQKCGTGNGTPFVSYTRGLEIIEVTTLHFIDRNGFMWSRSTGFTKKGNKKSTWRIIDLDEINEGLKREE